MNDLHLLEAAMAGVESERARVVLWGEVGRSVELILAAKPRFVAELLQRETRRLAPMTPTLALWIVISDCMRKAAQVVGFPARKAERIIMVAFLDIAEPARDGGARA
jgi:hypothetical protein